MNQSQDYECVRIEVFRETNSWFETVHFRIENRICFVLELLTFNGSTVAELHQSECMKNINNVILVFDLIKVNLMDANIFGANYAILLICSGNQQ